MRIGRATIIPAILTLGAAISILAGSAGAVAAARAPAAHVQSTTAAAQPRMHYHA
jgi:hypothetical protein